MKKHLACTAIAAALLSACGGGGSDGGSGAAAAPAAVQITQANAKPVGAHAADSVQNTGAAQGSTGLVTGVQVQGGGGSGDASTLLLAEAARSLAARGNGLAMASGVAVNESATCTGGGSIGLSGSVANSVQMGAGDNLTVTASQCREVVNGQSTTISGSMTMTVASGAMTTNGTPFHVVLTIVARQLSVTTGGVTTSSDGDLTLDWTFTSQTVQTLLASGTALANSTITGGVSRSTTWRNYRQSISLSGNEVTSSLSAGVESDSAKLGTGGGSYAVSTPTHLRWSTLTGLPASGVILVTGAGNSRLKVTFSLAGAALEVDADGDGSYESVVDSTAAELRALL